MTTKPDLQRQFFDMLMESQSWSPTSLLEYQRGQLSQLIIHAKKQVPFYATRLDAVIGQDGGINWDRWSKIPILTRKDMTERGDELLARSVPQAHGQRTMSRTSGTTGAAITLSSTQLAQVALNANRFRSYRWNQMDWAKDICSIFGDNPTQATFPNGARLGSWGPPWDPASAAGELWQINRFTSNEDVLKFMERIKPAYLGTGPKTAQALALEAERLGVSIKFDVFLPQGSMLGQLERETMQRVFGAHTAELYSSKEAGQLAHGCPSGEGLHVNAETVLVEILDEYGKPASVGQSGRVIVTPFYNSAQPLIRYEQGDIAQWMPTCGCGRTLPKISGLIGRSTGIFYHPDGRARAAYLRMADRQLLGASEWQISQTGPHLFEVRYVPVDWQIVGDEAAIATRIRAAYFEDAEVRFVRVVGIEPGPNGKIAEYVNNWLPRQATPRS